MKNDVVRKAKVIVEYEDGYAFSFKCDSVHISISSQINNIAGGIRIQTDETATDINSRLLEKERVQSYIKEKNER